MDSPLRCDEPEIYLEPPRMTRRDTLGVVAALAALFTIGLAGYVWLNPALSADDLLKRRSPRLAEQIAAPASSSPAEHQHTLPPAPDAAAGTSQESRSERSSAVPSASSETASADSAADPLVDPHLHDHDMSCPYCGMFSERSRTHVVVRWDDGSHTHHDCFDCVFGYEREQSRMLDRAVVSAFESSVDAPRWLDATTAAYLYDTTEIEGSMAPYVAAFADAAAAEAAQPQLGGQAADFAELRRRFTP